MGLMIQQIRFYGEDNLNNYPLNETSLKSLKTGVVFQPYTPILSIGIQSLPGTKFYINNSEYPVIIGYSGIYELKLEEAFPIYSIQFDLESLKIIHDNSNGYLIIDILYEEN